MLSQLNEYYGYKVVGLTYIEVFFFDILHMRLRAAALAALSCLCLIVWRHT